MEIKGNQPIFLYYRFVTGGTKDKERSGDFEKIEINAMTTASGGGNVSGKQIIEAIQSIGIDGQVVDIECMTFQQGIDWNSGISGKTRVEDTGYYFMYVKEGQESEAVLFVDAIVTQFVINPGDDINICWRYGKGSGIWSVTATGDYDNKMIYKASALSPAGGGITEVELVNFVNENCLTAGAEGLTLINSGTGTKNTGFFNAFSTDRSINEYIEKKADGFLYLYIDILIIEE